MFNWANLLECVSNHSPAVQKNIININHPKEFSCLPASALWRFTTCLTLVKSSCTDKISTRWSLGQGIACMTRFKTCCGEGVLLGLLPKFNRCLHQLSISTKILYTINIVYKSSAIVYFLWCALWTWRWNQGEHQNTSKIPEQVETSEIKVALQTTQLKNHLVLC